MPVTRSPAFRSRPSCSYHGRVALASAAATPFTRRADSSVLELAASACEQALAEAGLPADAVDGIATFSVYEDSVCASSVASMLGVDELRFAVDANLGGQAVALLIMQAAMAISSGLAENVLVFRALRGRSGIRVGRRHVSDTEGARYREPVGLVAYPQHVAMWIRRYLQDSGSTEEDLAAVVLAQRRYAIGNDRAMRRQLLSLDDYFASPYVVEPLRRPDCTIEVDGAVAILVTSLEQARDLQTKPVVVRGSAWSSRRVDLDMSGSLLWDDYARNFSWWLAPRLWASAGLGPDDVDVAQIYDCFSGVVLMSLEGLGFCGFGEAGAFVRAGATALDGGLPVNTNGGMLAEGYLQGMNTAAEAVWQIQGGCGPRQVEGAEVAVVCCGARNAGSALVLTDDR